MNRGARRQHVFEPEGAREVFLGLLSQLPVRFGVRVHAYALMGNHYHLLLTSSDQPLATPMKWLDQVFTQRLNHAWEWDGPVFRGRYTDVLVVDDRYWRDLLAYVHLNPHRAGMPDRVGDPHWTSHAAYLGRVGNPWLTTREHLDMVEGRRGYSLWLDELALAPVQVGDGPPVLPGPSGVAIVPRRCRSDAPPQLVDQADRMCRQAAPRVRDSVRAWWLRANGVPVREAATCLGVSAGAVSKRATRAVRMAEERPVVASWMAALSGADPRGGVGS